MALPPGFPVRPSIINLTQINVLITKAIKTVATKSFMGRILGMFVEFFLLEEMLAIANHVATFLLGGATLWWVDNHKDTAAKWIGEIADEVTKQSELASILAARTLKQITGVAIDEGRIKDASESFDRATYQVILGEEFTKVVNGMLSIPDAARDFAGRTSETGSFSNMWAFFGINMDFQLRSLTISTISSIFGIESLRHLEGLHQSINWAFGFGWLSWAVLANAMDVTVNAGVKRHFLKQIKPHDFTLGQTNKLYVRQQLSSEIFNQVHDNAGTRDDIRQGIVALEYKQPTETTLRDLYLHGLMTTQKVRDRLTDHEYERSDGDLVAQTIYKHREWGLTQQDITEQLRWLKMGWITSDAVRTMLAAQGWNAEEIRIALLAHQPERIFHLRQAVTAEHMKFLRHGWETQDEARLWLASQNWSEEEIALAFEANRLEMKAEHIPKPKHLSIGEIAAFVANGTWDPIRGQQYLVVQGYSVEDANNVLAYAILQHAIAITPKKVKDACETDNHLLNLLTAALGAVTVLDPLGVFANRDFTALVQCYIAKLLPAGSGTAPPTTPPVTLASPPVIHDLPLTPTDTDYAKTVWTWIRAGQAVPEVVVGWMVTPLGSQAMLFSQFAV